jgi:hypothetical protein
MHYGDDTIIKAKSKDGSNLASHLTEINSVGNAKKWSDIDYEDNFWNNSQTQTLLITKDMYNDLVSGGIQITVK